MRLQCLDFSDMVCLCSCCLLDEDEQQENFAGLEQ